jgi:hypothetical protein
MKYRTRKELLYIRFYIKTSQNLCRDKVTVIILSVPINLQILYRICHKFKTVSVLYTRGRPGVWETDLVHFIINGNIN